VPGVFGVLGVPKVRSALKLGVEEFRVTGQGSVKSLGFEV